MLLKQGCGKNGLIFDREKETFNRGNKKSYTDAILEHIGTQAPPRGPKVKASFGDHPTSKETCICRLQLRTDLGTLPNYSCAPLGWDTSLDHQDT